MIKELQPNDYNKILTLGKLIKSNFDIKNISTNEKVYVWEEDQIIGFIQILNLYETLEIINIAVSPLARRTKIGSKLLMYVIEFYQPKHILLEVKETNYDAIEFYKKNQFKEIRRIKNYYGSSDALVMERILYE